MPPTLTEIEVRKRRDKLVAHAADILEIDGLDALTLRRLAVKADVSRTTPYLYFKDKNSLLDAIRIYGIDILMTKCRKAIIGYDHYIDQMRLFGDCYVDFALDHPKLYHLIFSTILTDEMMSDEFMDIIAAYRSMTEKPMRLAYEAGILSLPPERLNPVLWSSYHGMVTLYAIGPHGDEDDFNIIRDDLKNILAKGFLQMMQPCSEAES